MADRCGGWLPARRSLGVGGFAARGKPRGEPAAGSKGRIVLGGPWAYNQIVSENLPSNFP